VRTPAATRPADAAPASSSPLPRDGALAALSDDEVVARVRAGEGHLFELLLRRHNQRLFRLVRSVLADDDEAADVLQEAWVRAWQHLDQFEGRAAFPTWAGKIALHAAWSRLRARRRLRLLPSLSGGEGTDGTAPAAAPSSAPEAEAGRHELAGFLEGAVDRLSPSLRLVFVLRAIEGLSTEDTAAILDIRPQTAKVRLHRARAALRRDLESAVGEQTRALYGFDGVRCDAIVAAVLAALPASAKVAPDDVATSAAPRPAGRA
jgi:RNA polymerase sigma-70 factor (ECF subfamily)